MKQRIVMLLILSLMLIIAPVAAELDISNGVDIFRGSWMGKISINEDTAQTNLYFGESVLDEGGFKTSGYFSVDEFGTQKRAKATQLPLMVQITNLDDGIYDLVILANVIISDETGEPKTTVMKLTGTANMGGSGVTDDAIDGDWYLDTHDGKLQGTWSAVHLDRRNIEAPVIIPEPPLYFNADLKIHLSGKGGLTPIEERNPFWGFDVNSNIVMDSVRVTFPDGSSVILPPYTDVFSPDVDWTKEFRFALGFTDLLPIKGVLYTFTALDVAGNPIPNVESNDAWVGVAPPDPPANVQAILSENGIQLSWDAVNPITGSFEPNNNIGWYQIEIEDNINHVSVYGANHISIPDHLIPMDRNDFVFGIDWGLPLSEMKDGSYTLNVNVHSLAPEGSIGKYIEYSSRDPDEFISFEIINGEIFT